MSKRVIASLAVLGAAITTTAVTSTAYADGFCPSGRLCMWEDPGFQGDRWVDIHAGPVGTWREIDGWNGDNEISSIDNATDRAIVVYANDGANGRSVCVSPHDRIHNLADWGFDNDAESYSFEASC